MSKKILYLVRHAESLQNIYIKRLTDRWDVTAIMPIVRLENAPLSDLGKEQVTQANEFLKSNNWNPKTGERSPDLVVHSPLIRAKHTAAGLYDGCDTIPMIQLDSLIERSIFEYMYISPLDRRISETNEWLRTREEDVIVIVGHGQFFRRWLSLGYTQKNVHVMER